MAESAPAVVSAPLAPEPAAPPEAATVDDQVDGTPAAPVAAPASAVDATYAKPNKVQRTGTKDQLDSMLGNLQVITNFPLT